jgi:hypothetical protein
MWLIGRAVKMFMKQKRKNPPFRLAVVAGLKLPLQFGTPLSIVESFL